MPYTKTESNQSSLDDELAARPIEDLIIYSIKFVRDGYPSISIPYMEREYNAKVYQSDVARYEKRGFKAEFYKETTTTEKQISIESNDSETIEKTIITQIVRKQRIL